MNTCKDVRDAMRRDVPDGMQRGFLVDESLPVPGADKANVKNKDKSVSLDNFSELKTVKRIMNLVDTMTDAHDNSTIKTYRDKVCKLPAKGYGTTEFDMSDERVRLLVNAGRQTARDCLKQ